MKLAFNIRKLKLTKNFAPTARKWDLCCHESFNIRFDFIDFLKLFAWNGSID